MKYEKHRCTRLQRHFPAYKIPNLPLHFPSLTKRGGGGKSSVLKFGSEKYWCTTLAAVAIIACTMTGCTALKEVAALRDVRFSLDRVTDIRVAGIGISQVRSYSDLSLTNLAQLGAAVAGGTLPLNATVHVVAENPSQNSVQARLLKMDWSLFLKDKETISGALNNEVVLAPGKPEDIPVAVSLDLMNYFQGGAKDLVELALSFAGQGGSPKNVSLRLTPTVNTPLGPMRYPEPITIGGTGS